MAVGLVREQVLRAATGLGERVQQRDQARVVAGLPRRESNVTGRIVESMRAWISWPFARVQERSGLRSNNHIGNHALS